MMLSGQSLSRDEILDALDQILQTYQEQKKRVSNDVLLLRYVWLDAISDKVRNNIPISFLLSLLSFFCGNYYSILYTCMCLSNRCDDPIKICASI
jgi:hypothetical protein